MKLKNRKILLIIFVCLFIGGLSIAKIAMNNNDFQLDEPTGDINTDEKDKETTTPSTSVEPQATEEPSTTVQQPEGSLSISWVNNAQSAITEFVVGAEVELEISCNKNAQIEWSVTKGELLGKLTNTQTGKIIDKYCMETF